MQGLRKRRHAVAFLGSCPTLLTLCWDNGIPAAELSIGPPPVTKWGAVSFLWRKRVMQRKLAEALGELPDVNTILMLSLSEKILLTPLAVERGIRVIWVEHDGIGRWLTKNPWLSQLRTLSKHVMTVVVSDLSREWYLRLGWDPAHIVSIPNGIDLARLQDPASQENETPPMAHERLQLGCIARLTYDKGVDLLVEAVSDLPQVSLTIVGGGREEGRLRALIADMGIADRVRLVPSVRSVGEFYRSLDVFVLPSRLHDPCPLAPMEAMLLGVPTIMTEACGTAGYLQPGKDAIVVRTDSSGALHEAVVALLSRERLASIAHNGKCTAREKFSLDRMVDAYEALLA